MHEPEPETEEGKLVEILRNPRDWIPLQWDGQKPKIKVDKA